MVDYIPRAYTLVLFVFLSVPSFGAANHLRSGTHTEPDNGGDGSIRRGRYLPADPSSELIPDEFMVTLGKDVDVQSSMDDLLAECPGAEILYVYEVVLNGFAVKVDTDCMGQWFEGHSGVIETVEESSVVHAGEVETWGLDRIDQRYGLDGQMYGNPEVNGEGVDIYIIDTGVRKTHEEFTNRVKSGFNVMGYGDINDDNGHGTHVAGTAAGIRYGVAKAAHIIPIKVLSSYGSGSWSGVARGIDIATVEFLKSKKPSVINMSIQGGKSILVNNAIQASSDAGVVVVVAASNYNRDACNYSPASAPSAITVAATWRDDSRSSYSSWGSCVDIFAPGSDITSAWRTSDTATRVLSGTSMASPHVAGAAALVLGEEPDKTPTQVASDLIEMATPNAVIDAKGSPNKLLFVGDITPSDDEDDDSNNGDDNNDDNNDNNSALIITGVMDNPNARAIELYSIADIDDLSDYNIKFGLNMGATMTKKPATLPSIGLEAGSFFLLTVSKEAKCAAFLSQEPDMVWSCNRCINGNDAVLLYNNNDALVDQFGKLNGSLDGWDYHDGWAYRKDGKAIPNQGSFVSSEWKYSGTDIWDDSHPTNSEQPNPFPMKDFTSTR